MKQAFTEIFETNFWGESESKSGGGSTVAACSELIEGLPKIFKKLNIKTFLDCACGDMNWMGLVDFTGVKYVGVDIVDKLIEQNRINHPGKEFFVVDFTATPFVEYDMVFCKDVFIHLKEEKIWKALHNIASSGSKYLAISNGGKGLNQNVETEGFDYRPNYFQSEPFNFPEPDETIGNISIWEIDRLLLSRVPFHIWSTDGYSQDIIAAVCRAEKATQIAEVGTCVGATAAYLGDRGFKVFTCDVEDSRDRSVKGHRNISFVHGDVDVLVAEMKVVGFTPQAAFIDGDHSLAGVTKDYEALLAAGVKLFFIHDCLGIPDIEAFCYGLKKTVEVVMVNTTHPNGFTNGLAIVKV